MSKKFNRASAIAVAATMIATLATADGSGASAQAMNPVLEYLEPTPAQFTSQPVIQALPQKAVIDPAVQEEGEPVTAETLREMVNDHPMPAELSREMNCLAGAVYFESKGETLPGQLAVGRVVVARSKAGRFPSSYCGVVFQPSQFSFVRGQSMPKIDENSRSWREAVAIAHIAHEGSWRSPAEGALFFHATHVSPRWRLTRVARIDNHIFYR
jgi:spore germination cell wall hydrolase CwlJ-like protein